MSMLLTTMLLFAAQEAQAPAAPEQAEKKICRRLEVTGARASFRRVCMTKAEWDAAAAQSSNEAQKLIDRGTANFRTSGF